MYLTAENEDPAGLKISVESLGHFSLKFSFLSKVQNEMWRVEVVKLQMVWTNHVVVSSACWEGDEEVSVRGKREAW